MPRIVRRGRKTREVAHRLRSSSVRGYKGYIDHYFGILGTAPEKMVYAELSARRIPFWFQNEITFSIPELKLVKDYRPDFAIPTLKVIIEVQGSYWHSKPEQVESDAYKAAVYSSLGWTVLLWWDYDIELRLQELFALEPKFASYPRGQDNTKSMETSNGRKVIRDDTKGIKTLNYRRSLRSAHKKKPVSRKRSGVGIRIFKV